MVVNSHLSFYAPMGVRYAILPGNLMRMRAGLSSTKKLITPERNSLADNRIEALECLKAWFDKGFIEREENVH